MKLIYHPATEERNHKLEIVVSKYEILLEARDRGRVEIEIGGIYVDAFMREAAKALQEYELPNEDKEPQ